MYIPKSFHTTLALETLIDHFSTGKASAIALEDLPDEFTKPAACFVSLYTPEGALRGCMGSVVAQEENLYSEIVANTLHAAFNDERVPPLKKEELESISLTVELIEPLQKVRSLEELQPETFGVMIRDKSGNTGVMLTYPAGTITVEQQLTMACKKGGIDYSNTKELDVYKFKVTAYA